VTSGDILLVRQIFARNFTQLLNNKMYTYHQLFLQCFDTVGWVI